MIVSNLCFIKPSRWFLWRVQLEVHWSWVTKIWPMGQVLAAGCFCMGLKEGSIVILWLFTICIYCTRHILRFIVNMKNKQLNVKNIWHYYPATQMCCFQYAFHMLNIVYYMYISVSKRVQSRWKSTSLLSAMSFKGPNPQGQTNMRSNKVPEIPRTEKTFSVTLFQTSQAFLR